MEFSLGSGAILLLIFCSLILVGVGIERWLYFRQVRMGRELLLEELDELVEHEKFEEAIELCGRREGSYGRILTAGLTRVNQTKQEAADAMSLTITEEQLSLERNLPVIGTIAVIAPFLGLFGTVLGIIRAFKTIAQRENVGAATLSAGIAEALYATAIGLFIAILAVVGYNYFKFKLRVLVLEWETLASRFLDLIFSKQEEVA